MQTGGDSSDKPKAMPSRSMTRSQFWTTVSIRTGSLSAPDVHSTHNNQPWEKPAVGSQPGSVLTFQNLRNNQYTTWLGAQKARASSRCHHKGLCVIQCEGWLTCGDSSMAWRSDTNSTPTPPYSIGDVYQPWSRTVWRRWVMVPEYTGPRKG